MRVLRQAGRRAAVTCFVVLAAALSFAGPSRAFDLFGLFGSDKPPDPSPTALPYDVTFTVKGDGDVEDRLQQASNLYRLRGDAPPDGQVLVQRAEADFAPLIDALWGAGYYNARVTVEVSGTELELGQGGRGRAARAAEGHRNHDRVPVTITAETGPLFRLRKVEVIDQRRRQPFPPDELPPRTLKLEPGDPARSADLVAAEARLSDSFRQRSYPLAKAPPPEPVVDHAAESMDVTFAVDPGPKAGIGAVSLRGPETFDPAIVRSFIYLEEGEDYSPDKLDRMRKSIAQIPAVGSVRVREADHLDANGNLPIFVEVTDRAPNLVGFSAGFSTIDGPTSRVYYENRNLFGGAERLRLQGDVFLAPRNNGSRIKSIGDFKSSDIGARFTVSFLKPALDGTRFDFLFDGLAERNRSGGGRFGGYTDRAGGATAGLRYRFDETLSASAGIKYERGQTSDVISNVDYQLVGVPVSVKFDNTDKPLDPTTGIRATATVTPYPSFFGSSVGFTRATGTLSAYQALDEDGRFVLAGRAGAGGFLDAPDRLGAIPSNYRFYVGGQTTIRGYRFQTVAPRGPFGFVTGGRSEFDASAEMRVKVTDQIGIAPFFDIGGAYASEFPLVRGDTRMSAGLGVYYITGIGPIRIDLAAPLDPRRGDQPLVLYVSIGQSF